MAHSFVVHTGAGTNGPFSINFTLGFLSRTHVRANVEAEQDALGATIYRNITWLDDGLVTVDGPAIAVGELITFRRSTPIEQLQHDFQNGATLDEHSLDEAHLQVLMFAQEIKDAEDTRNLVTLNALQTVLAAIDLARGPKGDTGIKGVTGGQGPLGDPGPKGETGIPGVTGPQGPVGDVGPQGSQGLPGIQGQQGPQGPRGEEGPQGLLGIQGGNGVAGDQGPMGVQGIQGEAGPEGVAGVQGPQGPIGNTGAQGLLGPTGNTGAQGPQGVVGAQGPQGPIGVTGAQGATGAVGPQGAQGPQGLTGTVGDTLAHGIVITPGGYIQSQDYVTGVSGWRINATGDAEFQSVKVPASKITAGPLPISVKVKTDSLEAGTALIARALIGYAAIGSAQIGTAEIGTLKIQGNAITVPKTAITTTVNNVSVTLTLGQAGDVLVMGTSVNGNGGSATKLYVDDVVVQSETPLGGTLLTLQYLHANASAGDHTYKIHNENAGNLKNSITALAAMR